MARRFVSETTISVNLETSILPLFRVSSERSLAWIRSMGPSPCIKRHTHQHTVRASIFSYCILFFCRGILQLLKLTTDHQTPLAICNIIRCPSGSFSNREGVGATNLQIAKSLLENLLFFCFARSLKTCHLLHLLPSQHVLPILRLPFG